MEQKYLIDTNIIIAIFSKTLPDDAKKFVANLSPIISAVTYIETLGWHKATNEQLAPLKDFMSKATILPIDHLVIEKTILIRQQKKIGLGDAIIAATSLVHHFNLLTRNTSDFKNITGLNVVNPYSL